MATTENKRSWKWRFWLIVFPLLLAALYTWFVLWWSFSEGDRAGYMQKLSKRGWVCKTWEGELTLVTMPGTVAEKFYFTVRREDVVQKLNAAMGQRVSLSYKQHVGIPGSCFGDTGYFVDDVHVINEATLLPGALPKPAETAPATPAPGTK
jgi:hypothetical protein